MQRPHLRLRCEVPQNSLSNLPIPVVLKLSATVRVSVFEGGGWDAEAKEFADNHSRFGAGGGGECHPVVRGNCLREEAIEKRSPPSPGDSPHVAPRWSRSAAEGRCREHGPKEGSAFQFKGEDGSPPSQAARFRAHRRLVDAGGLVAAAEAGVVQT